MAALFLYLAVAQAASLLAEGYAYETDHYQPKGKNIHILHEWKTLDFTYHSEKAREEAIRHGHFVPENTTVYEASRYKDRIFITLPRLFYGVPATLATVSDKTRFGQRLLQPFPNWEYNKFGNCEGLTNVHVTQTDEFGRLWVLDSGVVDGYAKVPTKVCQPKIVVFDLNHEDKVVGTYHIPDKVLDCNSYVFALAVDLRNNDPNDVTLYIADTYAEKLIVFKKQHNTFYRVQHKTFIADPHYVDKITSGVRSYVKLGLTSFALGPVCNGDRRVYYHAFSSVEKCYVMASTLQNKAFETNPQAYQDSFYCYSNKKRSPGDKGAITEEGILFYFEETFNAIACWNTIIDTNMENTALVARNGTLLQAVEALKLSGRDIYGISTRLHRFILGEVPKNEINYRLFKANVDDLIRGTPCQPQCLPDKEPALHHEY